MSPARLTAVLLPGLCFALPLHAAGKPAPVPAVAGAADPALIEFLADWQGKDGQWLDPLTFADIDPAKVQTDAAKRHGKAPAPAGHSGAAPAAGEGGRAG